MNKVRISRGRFFASAFLYFVRAALILAFVGSVVWVATDFENEVAVYVVASLFGGGILVGLIYYFCSSSARCPMCGAGAFGGSSCSRHGNARRLLGSYNLRTATRILVLCPRVNCQYCGGSYRFRGESRSGEQERWDLPAIGKNTPQKGFPQSGSRRRKID